MKHKRSKSDSQRVGQSVNQSVIQCKAGGTVIVDQGGDEGRPRESRSRERRMGMVLGFRHSPCHLSLATVLSQKLTGGPGKVGLLGCRPLQALDAFYSRFTPLYTHMGSKIVRRNYFLLLQTDLYKFELKLFFNIIRQVCNYCGQNPASQVKRSPCSNKSSYQESRYDVTLMLCIS